MVIQLDLPTAEELWWWAGVGYLLLSYFVLGPLLTRTYYTQMVSAKQKQYPHSRLTRKEAAAVIDQDGSATECVILWLCSPVTVPVELLRILCCGLWCGLRGPVCRLLFPPESTWRQKS